jgi:hypothetical protein
VRYDKQMSHLDGYLNELKVRTEETAIFQMKPPGNDAQLLTKRSSLYSKEQKCGNNPQGIEC